MRYGLLSDLHYGYHSGNKINEYGINVREDDHYMAGRLGVQALVDAGVDLICDGGDLAEVPAPKKRAILELINTIRLAKVPYLAVDGNHTSLKSSSDIHLYKILEEECDNFHGVTGSAYFSKYQVSMVSHSYNDQEIIEGIAFATEPIASSLEPKLLIGHWAAEGVPFVQQVPISALPKGIPTFLGHYHRYKPSKDHHPTYIGSTEKTAWDQWDYPTGVGIYDSDTGEYERIEIPTREWVNIESTVDSYMDDLESTDMTDKIVRLTVHATPAEYSVVDQVRCKAYTREVGVTQYTMRRESPEGAQIVSQGVSGGSLDDQWQSYVKDADLPKGVTRKRITEIGMEALN